MYIVSCVLLVVIIRLILLKRTIAHITQQINFLATRDTNRLVMLQSTNQEVGALIQKINELILKERQTTMVKIRQEQEIKILLMNVSHDLRTPLTVSRGTIQFLLSNKLNQQQQEKYLKTTLTHLDNLSQKMDVLFQYVQMQHKKITPKIEKINISNMLEKHLVCFLMFLQNKDSMLSQKSNQVFIFMLTRNSWKVSSRIL